PQQQAEIEVGARLELCLALQIDEVAVSQLGDHAQRARLAQRLLPGHPPCRNRLRQPLDRCPLNAVPAAQQLTDVLDHYWRAPLFIHREWLPYATTVRLRRARAAPYPASRFHHSPPARPSGPASSRADSAPRPAMPIRPPRR